MIKRVLCVVLALAATASFAQRVPKEWVSRYSDICHMLERKDVTGFEAMFDPSFVAIDKDGTKSTREEFFKMVDDIFKNADKVDCNLYLTRVNERNGRVDAAFDFKLNVRRKNHSTVVVHEIGVDSWKEFNHKWYLVKTVDTTMTMKESKPGMRKGKGR
jgi:hypothetical protein